MKLSDEIKYKLENEVKQDFHWYLKRLLPEVEKLEEQNEKLLFKLSNTEKELGKMIKEFNLKEYCAVILEAKQKLNK